MTEDEVKAIDHEIMMSEELISRDEVITLIARKHLSKVENFHGAITRLNKQVKKMPIVTVKTELVEVLDQIRAEIIQDVQNGVIQITKGSDRLFEIIDKHIGGKDGNNI